MNDLMNFNEVFWKNVTLIISNVTKSQGYTPSLENTIQKNHTGCQIDPAAFLGLRCSWIISPGTITICLLFIHISYGGLFSGNLIQFLFVFSGDMC